MAAFKLSWIFHSSNFSIDLQWKSQKVAVKTWMYFVHNTCVTAALNASNCEWMETHTQLFSTSLLFNGGVTWGFIVGTRLWFRQSSCWWLWWNCNVVGRVHDEAIMGSNKACGFAQSPLPAYTIPKHHNTKTSKYQHTQYQNIKIPAYTIPNIGYKISKSFKHKHTKIQKYLTQCNAM